ncbi:MAG: NUDIX hydrolase [Candidatus Diapherotrites archaeon]|nr:NUDIX hydrolase [Candidatus Diapherotrites archaeon]
MTEKIKVICANLIEDNGKILLVRETKEIARDKYNFPAGRLEGNESIVEGAVREAKEETGLDVRPVRIIGIYQKPDSKQENNVTIIVFRSEIVSGKITASEEHPEVKFFSRDEISGLNKKGSLRSSYITKAMQDSDNKQAVDLSFLKILE